MKETVYFIKAGNEEDDRQLCKKIERNINHKGLLSFIEPKDFVAIKTHFGEEGTRGYVRPVYFEMLGKCIKSQQAFPFLTETSTLYRGRRSNAFDHMQLAYDHGFGIEATGLPIIMADGLLGDEEIEIIIKGNILNTVRIAKLLVKSQAMVLVSHFTGHMLTGFGAALKNLGMGCASRKGKLIQHSTSKPSIKKARCTGCAECVKWCPQDAISLIDGKASIDKDKCIGCGECLAVCRFDAVGYNWSETNDKLQKKMVEHALGVVESNKGKIAYLNFLTRITKDCDCMKGFNRIVPDIGVLLSYDPVAIDAASLDLVEKTTEKKWSQLTFNVPCRAQIEYAAEIGLGNPDYQLIEII
ncbi:MAG: DUF362 domain-containing protein [Candidatus Aminicenantes bacterium]|nr:DUF362 domain-containing protein [Candidatus Aminicenantes bacterium]